MDDNNKSQRPDSDPTREKAERGEFEKKREEYLSIFQSLIKKHRYYPSVILARFGLRYLPFSTAYLQSLLVGGGGADQKSARKTKQQQGPNPERALHHLLACFGANQLTLQWVSQLKADVKLTPEQSEKLISFAGAARAAAYAAALTATDPDEPFAANASAAASAAHAVAQAATDPNFPGSAVRATAQAAAAAAKAATAATAVDATAYLKDIDNAQKLSFDEFLSHSLWPDDLDNTAIKDQCNTFIDTLKKIQYSLGDSDTKQSLQGIIDCYQDIISESEVKSKSTNLIRSESGGEGDQLNRGHLVNGLSDLLAEPSNDEHLTIGLLGHWGSGKTRVLDLLKESLQNKNSPFLFGEFNAWAYEHSKNIQAGMAHEVIKSLTTCESNFFDRLDIAFDFSWAKRPFRLSFLIFLYVCFFMFLGFGLGPLTELWSSEVSLSDINVLEIVIPTSGALGIFFFVIRQARSLFSQSFTKEWLTYVKLPDYAAHIGEVSEMREDIRTMCEIRLGIGDKKKNKKEQKRFLFVVDDLDRCNPEGIVKTFEAIRLVLDIPQVTVVVAIDQRIALAALAQHYESWVKHHQYNNAAAIARDYLGKMIHLPIVLNPPTQDDVIGYMSYLWEEEKGSNGVFKALINKPESKPEGNNPIVDKASEKNLDDISGSQEEGLTTSELVDLVIQLEIPKVKKNIAKGLVIIKKRPLFIGQITTG